MPKAAAHAIAIVPLIAVAAGLRANAEDRRAAAALAERLHLPLVTRDHGADLLLVAEAGRLALHEPGTRTRLTLEYTAAERRRYRAGASRDPLVRAIGRASRVVDATAGLGRDAVHLAWVGRQVIAIERHPVVAALLEDALAAATRSGALEPGTIELVHADAIAALPTFRPRPEIVYLDPMFPAKRRRSAAVRKEMRLLRLLLGEESEDAGALFEAARAAATARVIVKRPDHAPPLVPDPAVSYGGKLVRYDVYHTAAAS